MNKLSIHEKKLNHPYKATGIDSATKDIDESQRIVTGMFNSYFYIDSDLDMLLPGAAAKSIQERGPGTSKGNKIKHLKDHDWSKNVANILTLEEKEVEIRGRKVIGIYHESRYDKSQQSSDLLEQIKNGNYDARSIGYRYVNIELAEKDSYEDRWAKNWETYKPMALNPEKADEYGFFYIIKEIMLYEGSDVAFGANELTPLLGIKSADRSTAIENLFEKIDSMNNILKKGNISDEFGYQIEMQLAQIKSHISQMLYVEPDEKSTLLGRSNSFTRNRKEHESQIFFKTILGCH